MNDQLVLGVLRLNTALAVFVEAMQTDRVNLAGTALIDVSMGAKKLLEILVKDYELAQTMLPTGAGEQAIIIQSYHNELEKIMPGTGWIADA